MNLTPVILSAIAITVTYTSCYAGCDCDVWVNKGGYCVDYVKYKIPTFPIPQTVSEITVLKNKEIAKVVEGDVAIFDLGNYWHVAYVEKVHRDRLANAISIDVSEMNFGDQISFHEYKKKWKQKNATEWKRAICCGVTKKYGQISKRKNVALNSIEQVWSPVLGASREIAGERDTFIDKVREALNQLIQFTGREL